MNEKHLTVKHKVVLKDFLRQILCENMTRDEIINYVNEQFRNNRLEEIYSKTKLSNAISNIRFNERKSNSTILNIKIKDDNTYSYKEKLKKNVIKKRIYKDKKSKKSLTKLTFNKSLLINNNVQNNLFLQSKSMSESNTMTDNLNSMSESSNIFDDIELLNDNILFEIQNCKELPIF